MTMTTRMWGSALVLLLALTLPFDRAEGQSITVEPTATAEQADLLALHGRQLAKFRRNFVEASLYLRHAAELRGPDEAAVRDLLDAAHYAWYGGRRLTAMSTMYEAGKVAAAIGDRDTAQRAFMDAAWVGREAGRLDLARQILEQGMGLTPSQATATVVALTGPTG